MFSAWFVRVSIGDIDYTAPVCRCLFNDVTGRRCVLQCVCVVTLDFCSISFVFIKFSTANVSACHSNRMTVMFAVKV